LFCFVTIERLVGQGPGNIYCRHGTGANGHGTLIFLTLHIHGANIFFTNDMPMGQILFLMHYFVAEFSWMNKKNYRNSKIYCPLTSSLRAPSSEENIILYIDSTSNSKHSYTCSNHQINLIFYNIQLWPSWEVNNPFEI
jgi:hypothetical protein